ncbi:MAG TPA: thiosulfate oxidation carrier protein SoxY, partial [Hyphomicrobium sp.]
NGNFVPITIVVESPMTDADHVKAIHLLSTANPVAHVATFRLSPINAVARVQSRMRLAKTQDVVTLAELSTGQMLIATTFVKVTIGGCAD